MFGNGDENDEMVPKYSCEEASYWKDDNEKNCFRLLDNAQTNTEAAEQCRQDSAQLLTFNSDLDLMALHDLMSKKRNLKSVKNYSTTKIIYSYYRT